MVFKIKIKKDLNTNYSITECKKNMNKQTVTVVVLLILLLGALGYIGYNSWEANKIAQQNQLLQTGAQYGYQQAVVDLAQLATTCQQVPLRIGNQTINMIAVDCLRTAQQPATSSTAG